MGRGIIFTLFVIAISTGLSVSGSTFEEVLGVEAIPGKHNYVEYYPGNINLVVSAPHGGYLKPFPSRVKDGRKGYWGGVVTGSDLYTKEIAMGVIKHFEDLPGGLRPHFVVNNLHRSCLDPNRDESVGTGGREEAETAYREYHGFIDQSMLTAVEDDDAASVRLREMRARRLAAEINRTNAHPLFTPSGSTTATSTTTSTTTSTSSSSTFTMVSSSGTRTTSVTSPSLAGSPVKDKSGTKPKKRKSSHKSKKSKKSKRRHRGSSASSSSTDDEEPRASEVLRKEDWPLGYSAAAIDRMGIQCALKLSAKNDKKKKKDQEQLPGIDINTEEVKVATIDIKAGEDNAQDILHPQRFEFRPPMCHPIEWYKKIKIEWPERINSQFADEYLGTTQSIPASTFMAANRRTRELKCVHYMGKNYGVETRKKNIKSKVTASGKTVSEGYELPFYEAKCVTDIIMACCNLQAVCYQLWPWDYTPQVILRVAARYDFFSEGKDKQVKIFSDFFDRVLSTNAKKPTKPPQTYEQAILLAVAVMEKHQVAPVVPLISKYYSRVQQELNREPITPRGRGRGQQGRGQYANMGDRAYNNNNNGNNRNDKGGKPTAEVGKVMSDVRLLKVGNLPVCRNFNTSTGCTNTMDSANLGCVHNGVNGTFNRLHVCSIVVKGARGNDIRLCGASKHNAMACPHKK